MPGTTLADTIEEFTHKLQRITSMDPAAHCLLFEDTILEDQITSTDSNDPNITMLLPARSWSLIDYGVDHDSQLRIVAKDTEEVAAAKRLQDEKNAESEAEHKAAFDRVTRQQRALLIVPLMLGFLIRQALAATLYSDVYFTWVGGIVELLLCMVAYRGVRRLSEC